jgi:hypothetical protein
VPDELPPEFEPIAELVDQQPAAVREVFRFMLAMEESGIAELIYTAQIEGRIWCSRSAAANASTAVRPEIDAELETENGGELAGIPGKIDVQLHGPVSQSRFQKEHP